MCDKNLGPAVMERKEFIIKVFSEHLSHEDIYQELTPGEASYQLNKQLDDIYKWIRKLGNPPHKYAERFFDCALSCLNCVPQFYITAKVHKSPWKSRPVVAQVGSNIVALSKFLDFHLQEIARKCPSYIPSSDTVREDLKSIHPKRDVIFFTADAKSMYTMIDTEHALEVISLYLREFSNLSNDFINILIEGLGIVMRSNVFKFGSLFFLQLDGRAMGTPVACVYATIYFAYHERKFLIPKWGHAFSIGVDISMTDLVLDASPLQN